MKIELPEPLASYLAAEKIIDTEVLERCFTRDATVRDEGQTYNGLEAIKSWKQASQAKYQYSIEPLSSSQEGQTVTLLARLTGNFPGSPVELTYTVVLVDDKIASLEIR
ncbi:nuclear transport factor 2 family protein [Pseudomonas sp. TCU-HL1]|uniref:nuclear transport factor 2 family protein n=1 Tax=Pseudomonas sp. TCU-HL1 TaxID=1856685 RepID=UPI00083D41F3|nr:nuclear transport factor 2 family protein [Pseudomonas sp. TCU-HL1]AOE84774.1 polyketide cyclase [Pseudomonas sp. TCU-HL1]